MKRPARTFHRRFWLAFGLLLPVTLIGLFVIRPEKLRDVPAVLLEAPR
ncbi:MAG: hypothetical protein H2045_02500 [Rhizobiales bacterium]|nr:hypothetical protein [Hyphomicrobiales bacterium]